MAAPIPRSLGETATKPPCSPFLKLPRELRDMMYKFALVENHTIHYSRDHPVSPKPTALALFRVNRQVHTESIPIFYGYNTFAFSGSQTAVLLLSACPDAIKNIRHLHLPLWQSRLKGSPAGLQQNACRALKSLCFMLGTRGQLQSITIMISNMSDEDEFTASRPRKSHYKVRKIPEWAKQLATLKGLQRLCIRWKCTDFRYFGTMLASVKLLRANMLENGSAMLHSQGIRVRIRHQLGAYDDRMKERFIELGLKIDKDGKSTMSHERRSRVHPCVWCADCGTFGGHLYCICGVPLAHDPAYGPCDSCGAYLDKDYCRCGQTAPTIFHNGNKGTSRAVLHLHPDTTQAAPTEAHIWNSMKWGGEPLDHYLPYKVTREDFYKALALLDAGYKLKVAKPWKRGYADSDFGDADSLLTIDDWYDDVNGSVAEDDSDGSEVSSSESDDESSEEDDDIYSEEDED